ncbi:ATP-binding cassette domain-containing protein [Rhodococcus sp. USK10]|uniref:ATP-binding cassette domain-containing protein n=1 Tax=Rhodococcus sp. USK10 TaxID=2789739 RepID=UPI001C5CC576|nr:ATP-binding cassette domain-containing protein [Rhodococcus sp. USK10]QYB01865.1 ATP-binding cassette domain-containing protein [Rhodococcus sp. USK10]
MNERHTDTVTLDDSTGHEGRQGTAMVSARGLHKTFHNRRVLDNVDFDLHRGDITVIIGRSGSGKSTLLRAVAGLTEPDSGSIAVDGKVVFDDGNRTAAWASARADIGMVFQSYTLWPNMSVSRESRGCAE